jgi:hypothetical protein
MAVTPWYEIKDEDWCSCHRCSLCVELETEAAHEINRKMKYRALWESVERAQSEAAAFDDAESEYGRARRLKYAPIA